MFKMFATGSLFVVSLSLGGCIASANGSTPEDFAAQNNSAAAAQDNVDTATPEPAPANCPDEACAATVLAEHTAVAEPPVTLTAAWSPLAAHK